MGEIKTIELTGHANVLDSTEKFSDEILITYASAVLTIAGADGKVTEEEMEYVVDKVVSLGGSDEIVKQISGFDWRHADLFELVTRLKSANISGNCVRALLYDSIKASGADGQYHNEEKLAVECTAQQLGVDVNVVRAIRSVIELESSAVSILCGLLETDDKL